MSWRSLNLRIHLHTGRKSFFLVVLAPLHCTRVLPSDSNDRVPLAVDALFPVQLLKEHRGGHLLRQTCRLPLHAHRQLAHLRCKSFFNHILLIQMFKCWFHFFFRGAIWKTPDTRAYGIYEMIFIVRKNDMLRLYLAVSKLPFSYLLHCNESNTRNV